MLERLDDFILAIHSKRLLSQFTNLLTWRYEINIALFSDGVGYVLKHSYACNYPEMRTNAKSLLGKRLSLIACDHP